MNDAKWEEIVVKALERCNGIAQLSDIYSEAYNLAPLKIKNYPTYKDKIRQTLQVHSKYSNHFNGKELFYPAKELGTGVWGLKEFKPNYNELDIYDLKFPEGREFYSLHKNRERNPLVVKEAKKIFKEQNGRVYCQVCNFDFYNAYGAIGKDFIEAHHTIPISSLNDGDETKISDIALVCSNCHRMLHRKKPWLTIEELKKVLDKK